MIKRSYLAKFKSLSNEVKIAFLGIFITFAMSSYSLYLQNNESVSLKGIIKFHGTTTLSENVEYRLSIINSGNTPVSVYRVHFGVIDSEGDTVNSIVDVIEPFSIEPRKIKIIKLSRYLIGTKLRGLHKLNISFEVVDVDGNIYTNTFMLGKINIGGNLLNGGFQLPSYKVDLISGASQLLN
jgi:hypothetical protein